MRRTEKEIRDRAEIDGIIAEAAICRLALSDNGQPYVVPMNFGYHNGALYFHSAPCGRKIDVIGRNARVCFEIEADTEIVQSDKPCEWSMRYRSVIGFGTASLVENPAEKREALAVIGKHYAHRTFEVPDEKTRRVAIIKVSIDRMTGKRAI